MDTRSKILDPGELSQLLAHDSWVAVPALFDPLTLLQAQRLAELSKLGKILAIVLEDEDTLLSAEARAVLVAALASVSAVVIAPRNHWRSVLPESIHLQILEDQDGEKARSAEFRKLILRRRASDR